MDKIRKEILWEMCHGTAVTWCVTLWIRTSWSWSEGCQFKSRGWKNGFSFVYFSKALDPNCSKHWLCLLIFQSFWIKASDKKVLWVLFVHWWKYLSHDLLNILSAPLPQITFNHGEDTAVCTIVIKDDQVFENVESFYVELSRPVCVLLGETFQAVVHIDDMEDKPMVQFQKSVYHISEGAGFLSAPVERKG